MSYNDNVDKNIRIDINVIQIKLNRLSKTQRCIIYAVFLFPYQITCKNHEKTRIKGIPKGADKEK